MGKINENYFSVHKSCHLAYEMNNKKIKKKTTFGSINGNKISNFNNLTI